jgi:hypothetical protein
MRRLCGASRVEGRRFREFVKIGADRAPNQEENGLSRQIGR